MTLSSFRAAPLCGHLDRAKRVVGYLAKMKHGAIRFRTDLPDYSNLPDIRHNWEYSVYGKVNKYIPNAPEPLSKPVILTYYTDANLLHYLLTDAPLQVYYISSMEYLLMTFLRNRPW